jgi:hypothetical protein
MGLFSALAGGAQGAELPSTSVHLYLLLGKAATRSSLPGSRTCWARRSSTSGSRSMTCHQAVLVTPQDSA